MAPVGDLVVLYGGPGVEYWKGNAEFTDILGAGKVETPDVTRYNLSARMGLMKKLGSTVSLVGHVGHVWGPARAEKDGGEVKWWPGNFEGAAGVAVSFGGE